MITDYYKILGLEQNATINDINTAYRNLCKIHHPDKGGDTKMFEEINEAYIVLKDKKQKNKYDSILKLQKPLSKGEYRSLKEEFMMYSRSQSQEVSSTVPEFSKELDKKIECSDFDDLLDDISLLRKQDDIEITNGTIILEETEQNEIAPTENSINEMFQQNSNKETSFMDQFKLYNINDTHNYSTTSLEDLLKARELEDIECKKNRFSKTIDNGIFSNMCIDMGLDKQDTELFMNYYK